MIGLGHVVRLGVDIEKLRPLQDLDGLAARCFSPVELVDLEKQPPEQRTQAFFNCWTRKEAFIKAVGDGLSHSLQSFDVTLLPGETTRIRRIEAGRPSDWTIADLPVVEGFAGAAVVEGAQVGCSYLGELQASDLVPRK